MDTNRRPLARLFAIGEVPKSSLEPSAFAVYGEFCGYTAEMDFLRLPVYVELEAANTILLAGAGGGFDIFCGLPLYFGLRAAGKNVHLANLSFSTLYASNGKRMGEALVKVTAATEGGTRYFPEIHLAKWFARRGEDVPIYCIDRVGAKPVAAAYQTLVDHLKPDALVLIDGGTDSLMRGDEAGLGTPQEDLASISAAYHVDVSTKLLLCIGFGVDTYHGVCHAQFLEAVANLIRVGAFLGSWTLTKDMPEVRAYADAVEYLNDAMSNHPSIVSNSLVSAVHGQFGNHHATKRTEGSTLFINPLMNFYWAFQLGAVAERCLYLEQIAETETYQELTLAIERFRALHDRKSWVDLPM